MRKTKVTTQGTQAHKESGYVNGKDKQSHVLTADWLTAHPSATPPNELPSTPELKSFTDYAWPAADPYYSPVNPVFLIQFLSLNIINKKPSWFIRDGLIPLLWFFNRNPKPGPVTSKLYIEKSLEAYVPEAWAPLVGTYRISNTPQSSDVQMKSLLITGLMSENLISKRNLADVIKNSVAGLKQEELKSLPKQTCIVARLAGADPSSCYHMNYMIELFKVFGNDLNPISYNQMMMNDNYDGVGIAVIDEKFICADYAWLHHCLSRGGTLVNDMPASADEDRFEHLSPYHGVWLKDSVDQAKSIFTSSNKEIGKLSDFHRKYLEAVRSTGNSNLPWPHWFGEWVQAR